MLGGMLAGHTESSGEIIEENGLVGSVIIGIFYSPLFFILLLLLLEQ
jgi:hypothetical protein